MKSINRILKLASAFDKASLKTNIQTCVDAVSESINNLLKNCDIDKKFEIIFDEDNSWEEGNELHERYKLVARGLPKSFYDKADLLEEAVNKALSLCKKLEISCGMDYDFDLDRKNHSYTVRVNVDFTGEYTKDLSVAEQLDKIQKQKEQGNWVPANGGTETPFTTRSGRRLLYCYQPSTGNHAYLDLDSDLILSDEEARLALSTY